MKGFDADVLLVGGGLANGLLALRLKARDPGLRVVVLEREGALGGRHTWCRFESDVPAETNAWLAPLTAHRWDDGYEVRFPGLQRRLGTSYIAVDTESLDREVRDALGADVLTGAPATALEPEAVTLADGRRLTAALVVDGRGPGPSPHLTLGFQKFVGLELETAAPHGLSRPVIMDATVRQEDGYRFLYLLPYGPDRLLAYDTRYSDGEALDLARVRADCLAYAAAQGWEVRRVVREEDGVLPIALAGDIEAFWAEARVPRVGLAGAFFNQITGYSLAEAAATAEMVAALPELTTAAALAAVRGRSMARWREQGFYRLLNRMLFRAAAPDRRFVVLERFHRLPQPLIERFYAGRTTLADQARILVGKPPVSVGRALRVLTEQSVRNAA